MLLLRAGLRRCSPLGAAATARRCLASRAVAPATSFSELGLRPELCNAAAALGFSVPSSPQQIAVPPLLRGESVAFASSTGSGKTVAYLLPLMQQLHAPLTEQQLLQFARSHAEPR